MSLTFISTQYTRAKSRRRRNVVVLISQAWNSRHTYLDRLVVSRKLHSHQEIKRTESRVENLQKTDSAAAASRKHFASLAEFLRWPANSDKQFTIDPCKILRPCNFALAGIIYRPRNYGVRRYYVESSLKLYHSTVNNLKGSRMGASSFIKGVIDLIFSQFHVGW